MWNAIPTHLKSAPNGSAFKRRLREHIRMGMDRLEWYMTSPFMADFDVNYWPMI